MNHLPLKIELTRGPAVESSHLIHAVLMDGQKKTVAVYGDPARPTFPRSCIKPLQAIPLIETGAADAYKLSEQEVAIACASHSGEEIHVKVVSVWLKRLGLDETCLECGAHAPYASPSSPAAILCNNCSGKHTGMVTLSLFLKQNPAGYVSADHPVQQKILSAVGDMCGTKVTKEICGIDGCSAPNPVLSLEQIACGFASFMRPENLSLARGAACRRLFQAMIDNPVLVGGTGRMDTALMTAAKGKIMSKIGGEGVYAVVAPEKDRILVLKAEDGATRASQAALYALLEKHDLADEAVLNAIHPIALPAQKNWRGIEVGVIRI